MNEVINKELNSLYVHIPFCNRICTYCDFNKFLIKNQPVDEYVDALIMELSQIEDNLLNTIYIGGGTPTALNENQLMKLLDFIQCKFTVKSEFTMEANPDELTKEKILIMKKYGVNRLSLGVQTFDNGLLNILGRTHQEEDIERAVQNAREAGISSISIDLMYHLPTQTMEQCKSDLEKAVSLNIDHISSYSLILEPKTQFYNWYRKGMLEMSDELLAKDMYVFTMDHLKENGFHQYEISNYARPGNESLHNKVYWHNQYYYGAGAGSHGYIDGQRYYNIAPVPHYIKAMNETQSAIKETHIVTIEESMEEFMFLGLRLNEGISTEAFERRYGISFDSVFGDVMDELLQKGDIIRNDDRVLLTEKGRIIGNDVFVKFLISI